MAIFLVSYANYSVNPSGQMICFENPVSRAVSGRSLVREDILQTRMCILQRVDLQQQCHCTRNWNRDFWLNRDCDANWSRRQRKETDLIRERTDPDTSAANAEEIHQDFSCSSQRWWMMNKDQARPLLSCACARARALARPSSHKCLVHLGYWHDSQEGRPVHYQTF